LFNFFNSSTGKFVLIAVIDFLFLFTSQRKEIIMDIFYIGVVLLFLALSWGLVTFCERLRE